MKPKQEAESHTRSLIRFMRETSNSYMESELRKLLKKIGKIKENTK